MSNGLWKCKCGYIVEQSKSHDCPLDAAPVAEPRLCNDHCQVHPCRECAKLDAAFDEIYPPEPRTPSQREDDGGILKAIEMHLNLIAQEAKALDGGARSQVSVSLHGIAREVRALRTAPQPAPTREQEVLAIVKENIGSDSADHYNALRDILALYGESAEPATQSEGEG